MYIFLKLCEHFYTSISAPHSKEKTITCCRTWPAATVLMIHVCRLQVFIAACCLRCLKDFFANEQPDGQHQWKPFSKVLSHSAYKELRSSVHCSLMPILYLQQTCVAGEAARYLTDPKSHGELHAWVAEFGSPEFYFDTLTISPYWLSSE